MKKIYIISTCLIIALGLFTLCPVYAQKTKNVTVVINKEYNSEVVDTAFITYAKDQTNSSYKDVSILYSHGTPAKFTFALTSPIGEIRARVSGESKSQNSSVTYVQNGDSVFINVKGVGEKSKNSFIGKDSAKFQLQSNLNDIYLDGLFPMSFTKNEKKIPINLKTFYCRMQLTREDQLLALNNVKNLLSPELYSLYKANLDGKYMANSFGQALTFLEETNYEPKLFPVIRQLFNAPIDSSIVEKGIISTQFLHGLIRRTRLEHVLYYKKLPEMLETYEEIKNKFSGKLREQIISYYVKSEPKGKPEDYIKMVDDALQLITDKRDREAIIDLEETKKPGHGAYNFSLKNSNGKTVRLSDFKGKVVLLDFWFTGCPACQILKKVLDKDVLPQYKNNNDFIYVTVNIDKSKQIWLNSIKGGKYTEPEYINLNTNGDGSEHPVIINYKIRAYPTLIVIDKEGKIISSNFKKTAPEIIKYINMGL